MKKLCVVGIICATALTLSACGSTENVETSGIKSNDIATSTSVTESKPIETTSASASASTSTLEQDSDDRGIPEVFYFAVAKVIEDEFEIPIAELERSSDQELSAYSMYAMQDDSLWSSTYDYSMALDEDKEIISASFGITNMFSDYSKFMERAMTYLYIAGLTSTQINEDSLVPDQIYEAIPTIDPSQPLELTEGDAVFTLNATKDSEGNYSSFWLSITKAIS